MKNSPGINAVLSGRSLIVLAALAGLALGCGVVSGQQPSGQQPSSQQPGRTPSANPPAKQPAAPSPQQPAVRPSTTPAAQTPSPATRKPVTPHPDGPIQQRMFKQIDVQSWILISQLSLPDNRTLILDPKREQPLNPRRMDITGAGGIIQTFSPDRFGGASRLPKPIADPRFDPASDPTIDRYFKLFRDERIMSWTEGVIYMPAGINTSTSEAQFATATLQAWFDGQDLKLKNPPIRADLQAGARYYQFDLGARDRTKTIRVETRQPYRSIERQFNEEVANTIPWHDDKTPWPLEAKSALEPVFLAEFRYGIEGQPDPIQAEIDRSKAEMQKLLTTWLAGNDLRKLPPVMAAKFITGKIIDTFPPSGRSIVGPDGGPYLGLDVRTVPEILTGTRAQPEDVPMLLAAFLRTAGIPARTVYALDVRRRRDETDRRIRIQVPGQPSAMRIWTEFAVWDEESRSAIWIPIDILEQRKSGSRAQGIERRWQWFGHNEDSAYFVPISFHVAPPVPAFSFDKPNFASFYFAPYTPAMQMTTRFDVISQNSREQQQNKPRQR
jgi:hypothetical protein